jgi:hypothetical protein
MKLIGLNETRGQSPILCIMSNAGLAKRTVGLIRVTKCDRNITRGLRTLYESGVTKVIVVDESRSDGDYAKEPSVADGHVQIYCERDIDGAERRLAMESCFFATYVLEVPPTFFHPSRGLLEVMAGTMAATQSRQAAVAPRYVVPPDYVSIGSLFLLTHLIWSFFGLVNRWRTYRGTYAVLRTVIREIGTASIVYDRPGPWRGMEGAWFCPVAQVSAVNNWAHVMTLERFGFWRCVVIFIYLRLATFPFWSLARDPTQWRALFPVPLVLFWIVQAVVALIYCHQYYPDMPHALFQAAVIPMICIPWCVMAIWAKLIWRGYQGTPPTMQWPNFDPPTLPDFGFRADLAPPPPPPLPIPPPRAGSKKDQ